MKLLILGLILIGVLIIEIYYTNKNKETFENEVNEALVAGERKFLQNQDKYWDVRKQGIGAGLLTTKPGINDWFKLDNNKELKKFTPKLAVEQGVIDKGIVNCRALTKCDTLGKNNCGYCAFDKEFRYGTKDGPTADVCPSKAWTTDPNKCAELREKEICSNVESCGDLYGDAAKICGYCPTTGKSMAMKKIGDKYYPKYPDDVCSAQGHGLIPGDKCGKFLSDHPCITPYYLTGPHSAACVKKLWKNSKCTDTTPYGKSYDALGKAIRMPYTEVGTIMQDTNTKTRSTEYSVAVDNSDLCFGNHNNIKPCDTKYSRGGIPHPACLRKEFKAEGCTEKGTGWKLLQSKIKEGMQGNAKKQVGDVSKYSKGQSTWNLFGFTYPFSTDTSVGEYKTTMKRVNDLTVEADDYPTRLETSMQCFGETPPPPPEIKPGDTVGMTKQVTEGLLKFEGVVTGMRPDPEKGPLCKIMWIKNNSKWSNKKRENMSLDDQKKYVGWDSIPPTINTEIKAWINKGRLNSKKVCSNNKSVCKITCKDKIRNVLYKYPRPRDCIVGNYSNWSTCSKPCGRGEQVRTRPILYPSRYGGAACPVLKNKRVCNTDPCMNPNFTEEKKISCVPVVSRFSNATRRDKIVLLG